MENLIKQLFYGQLNINEQKFTPSLELKNLYKKLQLFENDIFEKLDDDDKNLFSNYIEIYQNISCENEERVFIQRFKIGAELTLQMFVDFD